MLVGGVLSIDGLVTVAMLETQCFASGLMGERVRYSSLGPLLLFCPSVTQSIRVNHNLRNKAKNSEKSTIERKYSGWGTIYLRFLGARKFIGPVTF